MRMRMRASRVHLRSLRDRRRSSAISWQRSATNQRRIGCDPSGGIGDGDSRAGSFHERNRDRLLCSTRHAARKRAIDLQPDRAADAIDQRFDRVEPLGVVPRFGEAVEHQRFGSGDCERLGESGATGPDRRNPGYGTQRDSAIPAAGHTRRSGAERHHMPAPTGPGCCKSRFRFRRIRRMAATCRLRWRGAEARLRRSSARLRTGWLAIIRLGFRPRRSGARFRRHGGDGPDQHYQGVECGVGRSCIAIRAGGGFDCSSFGRTDRRLPDREPCARLRGGRWFARMGLHSGIFDPSQFPSSMTLQSGATTLQLPSAGGSEYSITIPPTADAPLNHLPAPVLGGGAWTLELFHWPVRF